MVVYRIRPEPYTDVYAVCPQDCIQWACLPGAQGMPKLLGQLWRHLAVGVSAPCEPMGPLFMYGVCW